MSIVEPLSDDWGSLFIDIDELGAALSPAGDYAVAPTGKSDVTVGKGNKTVRILSAVIGEEKSGTEFYFDTVASGLIEPGGIELLPNDVAYVDNAAGGWNPVLAYYAIDEYDRYLKVGSLMLAENGGEIPVITCETNENLLGSIFYDVDLTTTADGRLAFAAVLYHTKHIVVGVENTRGGLWNYYRSVPLNASPFLYPKKVRLSFDQGQPLIAVTVVTEDFGSNILMLKSEHLEETADSEATRQPSSTAVIVPPHWEEVDPSGSVASPYMHAIASGISADDNGIYIAAARFEGNYETSEIRLLYQCTGEENWNVESVDRVHRFPARGNPRTINGDLVIAYGWGFAAGYDSYTSQPPDSVILARRTGTPCPSLSVE